MFIRLLLSSFAVTAIVGSALADNTHIEPPARTFQPELIAPIAVEPAAASYLCGTSIFQNEMIAAQLNAHAQSISSAGVVPVISLPPIQTTPIQ